MKLHRAFRHMEPRCDLLIREPLENSIEHILLPMANFHARTESAPRGEQLLGALCNHLQQRISGDDHQLIILRRMAPHQTMNREQASNLFDGHTPIGVSLHTEPHGS